MVKVISKKGLSSRIQVTENSRPIPLKYAGSRPDTAKGGLKYRSNFCIPFVIYRTRNNTRNKKVNHLIIDRQVVY